LATRPAGVNLAMEYTTWNNQAYCKHGMCKHEGHDHNHKHVHSHLQATGFYQESQESDDLGEYFGIGNGKNSFQVGPQESKTSEVDGRFLIHESDTGDNITSVSFPTGVTAASAHPLAGLVSFNPSQKLWGVRFDYFQDISHGFFFKANLPVVHVSNTMGMKICNSVPVTVVDANADTTTFSLADFFAGRVNVDKTANPSQSDLQGPLTKAKICGERSATGVADLDLELGYKLWNKHKGHVYLNLGVTIPTGRKPTGEWLFEPIYGNGGHVGFGAGIDAGFEFWHAKRSCARILFAANYRYLFDSTEQRTLGINRCNFPWVVKSEANTTQDLITPRPPKLMQYYLVALDQQIDAPLIPAANILTRGVKVRPGSQLDAMVDLNFKSCGFIVDVGYNLYWRESECVSLKNSCNTSCDGAAVTSYGFVHPGYNTHFIFNEAGADPLGVQAPIDHLITNADLSTAAAETPSQLTNKVFAGLGYGFDISHKYLASLGLGGSYEFASDNSAIEAWAVWGKAGISF